ncbi:F-box domain [Lasallia pustulata]|uniref:F-box domain n=1 Tax=Lasallia pustulata TaxID=136370 RepID=A0A1W5D994_9LECA|nr:F-box domain [Lasallia pustulata]
MALKLLDIPPEVLDHILSYLDIEPPSLQALHQEPSITLTESNVQPLKKLSLISHSLRRLIIPRLFKFSRIWLDWLCIEDLVELSSGSEDIDDFLNFVRLNDVRSHVEGLVLYTEVDLDPELDSTGLRHIRDSFGNSGFCGFAHLWRNLLTVLNPLFITMVAPPSTLTLLASCISKQQDAWAFDMPFHILHLKHSYTAPIVGSLKPVRVADLFYLRDWSHCTLNEGSSLKAYSTDEYSLKIAPSIATLRPFKFMTWFTSLDYIAIFPLTSHTYEISGLVKAMPNLESLRVRLAPEPSSKEDKERMRKNVPADMWMELDNGYSLILHSISALDRLKHFESLDYAAAGLQAGIDAALERKMRGWRRCGEGCWIRDSSLDSTKGPVTELI